MKEKNVLRNYDNRELTDDEELVTYFKNEADADNLLNPDSIVRRRYGRACVTGVRTAFKKGFEADTARKQFNSYINDLAGHFHPVGVGSLEQMQEDYDLEKGSNAGDPSAQHELYGNTALCLISGGLAAIPRKPLFQAFSAVLDHAHCIKVGEKTSYILSRVFNSCCLPMNLIFIPPLLIYTLLMYILVYDPEALA